MTDFRKEAEPLIGACVGEPCLSSPCVCRDDIAFALQSAYERGIAAQDQDDLVLAATVEALQAAEARCAELEGWRGHALALEGVELDLRNKNDALVAENAALRETFGRMVRHCAPRDLHGRPDGICFPSRQMLDEAEFALATPNERAAKLLVVVEAARELIRWQSANGAWSHRHELIAALTALDGDKPTTPLDIPAHKGTEN